MKRSNLFLLLILLLVPVRAAASDPTPLFVLFIGIPFLLCSILFLVVCFFARRLGALLAGVLLLAQIPIMGWASDVGYMGSAGGWLVASLFISGVGLLVAFFREKKSEQSAELSISDETRQRNP